jgi:hypothetical protein
MVKKIGIALLVLLVALGIGLGWMWHRLTALPQWYESSQLLDEQGRPRVDEDWVTIPDAERPPGAPADAEVYVLRNPHLRSSARKTPIERAIKQSRAAYSGGKLEAGAVVNLGETDLESLSAAEREQVEEVVDAFPALTGRDVYVGLEGGVEGEAGKLALGPDTKLRVGDTSYTIASAAKRLGMSESQLRNEIEKELARMDVQPPDQQ